MRASRNPETGKTYYVPADMKYKEWKERFVDNDQFTSDVESGIIKEKYNISKSVVIPDDCEYLLKAKTNFENKRISTDVLAEINKAIDI